MKLLDRISMLAKADAHGVVESLEDRALLLKQYVREAEIEVDHKRARLEALGAERKRLSNEEKRLANRIEKLDEDIALAMKDDQDDLARFFIKKLLPSRTRAAKMNERLEQIDAEEKNLQSCLETQQEELENLKARVRSYLAQPPSNEDDLCNGYGVADEDVEMELLRRRRAAEGVA